MLRAMMVVLLGVVLAGNAATEMAEPKCLVAEINPVTGRVLCLNPLGAPVEAPPEEAKLPCKPEDARGQWSYGPNCTPVPEGM